MQYFINYRLDVNCLASPGGISNPVFGVESVFRLWKDLSASMLPAGSFRKIIHKHVSGVAYECKQLAVLLLAFARSFKSVFK